MPFNKFRLKSYPRIIGEKVSTKIVVYSYLCKFYAKIIKKTRPIYQGAVNFQFSDA